MEGFKNEYGLLNAELADTTSENTFHISLQYLLLGGKDLELRDMHTFFDLCWNGDMFDNGPQDFYNEKDNYTSPDQLNGYICFSGMGSIYARSVWEHLKNNIFTYDNISGKVNLKRLMQPTTIFLAWYYATGNIFAKIGLQASLSWSLREDNSESGKLKAFVICKTTGFKKLIEGIDWANVQKIVRPEGHPIRELLNI